MEIKQTSGIGGTTGTRSAGGKRAVGDKSFSSLLTGETSEASEAAAARASSGVGLEGILALQEVDDATIGRRKARKHGETLLDRLDEIRHGLILGTIPRSQLNDMKTMIQRQRDFAIDDPRLAAIIDDIELRVLVELAKLGETV